MSPKGIGPLLPSQGAAGNTGKSNDPQKIRDAAQQFEALLIGQILRSVRESGSGWLGSGGDSAGDCATEFAEQHLALTIAHNGGLGLADLVTRGLEHK